jgi:hypothetical protein
VRGLTIEAAQAGAERPTTATVRVGRR